MQRFLQLIAVATAVIGLALWFFGGMHFSRPDGKSFEKIETSAHPGEPGGRPGADFRPGVGFLIGSWAVAATFWIAGSRWPKSPKSPA